MTTTYGWLLLIHIAAAIIGLGPSFVYGRIMAAAAAAGPSQMPFAVRLVRELSTRWTHPLALTVLLSGVALIWVTRYDIFRTGWLALSTILFLASFLYATFVQGRDTARSLDLIEKGLPNLDDTERIEMAQLRKRSRYGGIYMRLTVVVVLFLMVMKPSIG